MGRSTYRCTPETKDKLLNAILELVREKGYQNVTVRDICRRAGVSSGSFYHHYGSKEALVLEAYLHIDRQLTQEMLTACNQLPPLEALRRLMELHIRFVAERIGVEMLDYYRVLLDGMDISSYSPQRPYYRAMVQQMERCIRERVVIWDGPAEDLVDYCMHTLRGLIFDWALHQCTYDLEARFQKNFSLLVRGLLHAGDREEQPPA